MNTSNDNLMAALMEQMGGNNNSKMEMLAKILAQQNNQPQNTAQPQPANGDKYKGQARKLMALNKELKDKLLLLKKQKEQLLQYLDYFIEVNAVFSSAVGACECWGDDPQCEKCRGQGKPGAFAIQQEAFQYYIRPALKQQQGPEKEQLAQPPSSPFKGAR